MLEHDWVCGLGFITWGSQVVICSTRGHKFQPADLLVIAMACTKCPKH